ncbi:GNAT family N-acetyltransferase [Endozoicomonas sp. ALB115]|uniref:GNAT family N-acetyltransferase n=1 Tax=Endozoicomonas sp. ALB115 TaxID=3403074 RepID=UPI003BB692D3
MNNCKDVVYVDKSNFDLVLPLIEEYQRFYGATPDIKKNRLFFEKTILNSSTAKQFIIIDSNGRGLGFATLYQFYSSTQAADVLVMNDLYVRKESRGKGLGRQLITACYDHACREGYPAIQWTTAFDNEVAQQLYNGIPKIKKSSWLHYRLAIEG